MKSKGIEIYVHIPFCARKCDYCDFVSFACNEEVIKSYFEALNKQIDESRETIGDTPVVSLFFGGGTPSLPKASYVTDVLLHLKRIFKVERDAEISIEMNPNSATYEKIKEYRDAGFNRVSIGLQSANDAELKALSRLHTYNEFIDTYKACKDAGFENINIDLMSAIPGQTLTSYRENLERVVALKPTHISAYSLIIEEGTPFYERYKDGKGLPDEDTEREMYYLTKDLLRAHGYERYEISNYALKGYECKHNLGYWERTPYIGYGIAASSLLGNKRLTTHSDIKRYINGDFSKSVEELSKEDIMEEFMFLGLRCVKGILKSDFYNNFSVNIESVYSKELNKLMKEGLLLEREGRIFLSDKGMDVANYCMSEFIR